MSGVGLACQVTPLAARYCRCSRQSQNTSAPTTKAGITLVHIGVSWWSFPSVDESSSPELTTPPYRPMWGSTSCRRAVLPLRQREHEQRVPHVPLPNGHPSAQLPHVAGRFDRPPGRDHSDVLPAVHRISDGRHVAHAVEDCLPQGFTGSLVDGIVPPVRVGGEEEAATRGEHPVQGRLAVQAPGRLPGGDVDRSGLAEVG